MESQANRTRQDGVYSEVRPRLLKLVEHSENNSFVEVKAGGGLFHIKADIHGMV